MTCCQAKDKESLDAGRWKKRSKKRAAKTDFFSKGCRRFKKLAGKISDTHQELEVPDGPRCQQGGAAGTPDVAVDDRAALLADPVQLLAVSGVVVDGGVHTAVAQKSEAPGEAKETNDDNLLLYSTCEYVVASQCHIPCCTRTGVSVLQRRLHPVAAAEDGGDVRHRHRELPPRVFVDLHESSDAAPSSNARDDLEVRHPPLQRPAHVGGGRRRSGSPRRGRWRGWRYRCG